MKDLLKDKTPDWFDNGPFEGLICLHRYLVVTAIGIDLLGDLMYNRYIWGFFEPI